MAGDPEVGEKRGSTDEFCGMITCRKSSGSPYEYEPLTRGEYSLEAHLNYAAQGTASRDGTLLPTGHQTHLTLEPTIGVSPWASCSVSFRQACVSQKQ
jgi:hypothetical protein